MKSVIEGDGTVALEIMRADKTLGFGLRVGSVQALHRDPARAAQLQRGRGITAERHEDALGFRRRRQGREQRVEIERKTRCRLARVIDIAAAAPEFATDAASEKREGDAAVIFEAAMIGGIDGE